MHAETMAHTKQTIGDRIRIARTELRKRRGLPVMPQREIADALNISIPSVSEWERNTAVPGRDKMLTIAGTLGVNILWLEYGLGLPRSDALTSIDQSAGTLIERAGRRVPVINPTVAVQSVADALAEATTDFAVQGEPGPRAFACEVWDASNRTDGAVSYAPGDWLVIDPDLSARPGDLILARGPNGSPVFGELWVADPFLVHHHNPAFGQTPLDNADCIIGVVVEHTRLLRR